MADNEFIVNLPNLAQEARTEGLEWPSTAADGRYTTRNQLGAMSPRVSELARKFINDSLQLGGKVLEIGCAYGLICMEALESGVRDYVANDVDEGHLKILARKVMDDMPQRAEHLTLLHGSFPESTKSFSNGTFDAILVDNVLHFFTETQIKLAFKEFKRLLKPGGKLFGAATTAYIGMVRKDFIETYERKVSAFLSNPTNLPVPGFIARTWDAMDRARFSDEELQSVPITRGHSFVFDQRIVAILLSEEKFVILVNEYETLDQKPWSYDGRERLVFIAQA
uniref:Methyltransferase domain-containing protein n=1 Tax=Romanomermis culicivorax TaxID=13658 RepID=A0A915KY69_ROMCU